MSNPAKDSPPIPHGLPPEEGIASSESKHPTETTTPPSTPDILRYRPGIAALAAVILIVCLVTSLVRWADDRFFVDSPVSRVVCRNPLGEVEILPRGTTVGQALEAWGMDTTGVADTMLKRKIPDGCRITVEETRTGRRVVIEELPPAERYALGLDFNINRASAPDLALIPGIGEASASRVVAYRRAHGDFASEAGLCEVPGLGDDKARTIARYVSFGTKIGDEPESEDIASADPAEKKKSSRPSDKLTKNDPPVDINRAERTDLMRIPGVGEVTAERIIDCRKKNGPFRTVADLEKVEGIGKKKAQRIGGYIKF
jgi:competence ComEA-like helix-hairpin-helix protein